MSTPPSPDPVPPQPLQPPAYGYPQPGSPADPAWPAPAPQPKRWSTSAKVVTGVAALALVIGGTALTTLALTNNPETTTTGSDKPTAPTGYRSDNLNADEKAFMDVVFANSTKKGTLSEMTAAEIAAMVIQDRQACLQPEDKRADLILVEASREKGREPVNKAFKEHLCKGVPALPQTPAEPTKEDASQGHTGDVTITKAGNKPEYGIKKYEVEYKITNSGTQAASYFVEFEAYDKDGDFLGESSASAKRLGVGKSETGDVTFYDHSIKGQDPAVIASVKVKEVTYCDENSTNYMCSMFKN
ncbi:hypothetical protein ACFRJ1_07420 [Streptomyces sp. NPDC056773]|uniref:hypothetical protein n=1 Tax=unclassified Streptomyces TaxID=2593676 RepID=UPI0036793374